MSDSPRIVNLFTTPWKSDPGFDHYQAEEKRLTLKMDDGQSHVGASLISIPPNAAACPHHWHLYEDEIFLVHRGQGKIRVGDEILPLTAGDVVSFPRGERVAHQIFNDSDANLEVVMIGENVKHEVCYYPDSDKWLVRGVGVGRFSKTDYWEGEIPAPFWRLTRGEQG